MRMNIKDSGLALPLLICIAGQPGVRAAPLGVVSGAPEGRDAAQNPPIPIRFTLPEDGRVTLVVEDADGKRVRNLVADTPFKRGLNTVFWDGSDDLGRDSEAPRHGLYYVPTRFVPAGRYRVRGLWHKPVDVTFETGLYSSGKTPWETADTSGGWLSNHTPPNAMLYVPDGGDGQPAMLIGSYVSEGTAGLAWVDLEGHKRKHQVWVGGAWTGAPYLARDTGRKAITGDIAYAAVAWTPNVNPRTATKPDGEIRVTAITVKGDRAVVKYRFLPPVPVENAAAGNANWKTQISGLAVHNGLAVVSLAALNQLLLVDTSAGKVTGTIPLDSPRGLAFDEQGHLLALSGRKVVRFRDLSTPEEAPVTLPMVLEDPQGITLDGHGTLYISDRGQSHQVKAFDAAGRLTATFGKAGVPTAGRYDRLRMNNPRGLAVGPGGRLWVAEEDYQPKRVSVWNADGTLWKAFYGPADYGGGGSVDPRDSAKFYYRGMGMKLDFEKGTSEVTEVFYRPGPDGLKRAYRSGAPQTVVYVGGRRYFHNAFNSNPTNGHGTAFIYGDRNGVAVPIAAAGVANEWDVLKAPAFKTLWPRGTDPSFLGSGPGMARSGPFSAFFLWSDASGDGEVQPDEVSIRKVRSGGVTVMDDLSFVVARYDSKAMRFAPKSFTAAGVPLYDAAAGEVLVDGVNDPTSTGGDQVLMGPDGWSIFTTAPKPFSASGIAGVKNGAPMWSYPSLWPGLHASHESAVPDRQGELIGTTRVLGNFFQPHGGEPLWMLNGNMGPIYVFTADGLFVTQLFQDMRLGKRWTMPEAKVGMSLNDLTPSDENFWPSVTQAADGTIQLVTGRPNSLARVEGLESVRRIAPVELDVTAADLRRAAEYFARAEGARQAAQGSGVLHVALNTTALAVDGKMDDWKAAEWVDIDKRGTKAYFQSPSKPYDVTASVAITGDRLYAAWRTGDDGLLQNSGEVPNALFKTGGALDLMIGADAQADPNRAKPVAGDQRLLVTKVGGKTRALLYKAVVAGAKEPVPFASPVSTISFDRVDDVSADVELAGAEGNYEISVPLAVLGLKPQQGQSAKADIGILRGAGGATTQRVYWTNKATSILSDVPSEAELRPNLWGRFEFGLGK